MSKLNRIWYHPDLVEQARELRNNPTKSESVLWQKLKGKQIKGYDFHRQKPLVYFIVDFYCTRLKLAIEIDGEIHNEEEIAVRDQRRQELLEDYGILFLRFTNHDVLNNIERVVQIIEQWIKKKEPKNG